MIEWVSGLEWGDVPTWVSSVGGLGALFAASFAAWRSHGLFQIESNRDKEARERDERAQADLVAAWLDRRPPPDGMFPTWHIIIGNGNKVPMYAVQVLVIAGTATDGSNVIRRSFPVLQPGEELSFIREGLLDSITLPLAQKEAMNLKNALKGDESAVIAMCQVWTTFRDASGVNWTRSNDGILRRGVSGPFAPTERGSRAVLANRV